jgi:hypothetical protein
MQTIEALVDDEITMERLYAKSEKLRKTMWGQHAGVVQKIATQDEKLEWAMERLARLERTMDGR